jgi:hypothetical protein
VSFIISDNLHDRRIHAYYHLRVYSESRKMLEHLNDLDLLHKATILANFVVNSLFLAIQTAASQRSRFTLCTETHNRHTPDAFVMETIGCTNPTKFHTLSLVLERRFAAGSTVGFHRVKSQPSCSAASTVHHPRQKGRSVEQPNRSPT